MNKILFLFIISIITCSEGFSIPVWEFTSSSKESYYNSKYKTSLIYQGGNSYGIDILQFNSDAFHKSDTLENLNEANNQNLSTFYTTELNNNKTAPTDTATLMEAENIESEYLLIIIYTATLLAFTLFVLFIYLRKYKKLVDHLRDLNKKNKDINTENRNLININSLLESLSEIKIKELNSMSENNEIIRNQHERMLEYNFSLEKIIDERTKQMTELNKKLTTRNKQTEQFAHIISRKTQKPLASLKGLLYLLQSPYYKLEEREEFSKRIMECVIKLDNLVIELQQVTEQENNSQ
jgi:signal transduction histidine kinase